jgi:NADH-quinone oxidoreductase subunit K
MNVPISYYLILAALLFFIGVYGFIVRKNLIGMLMAVELMLNAVNINFVVFNRFLYPGKLEGFVYSLFIIVVAAAETAIAIAIILNIYRNYKNINVDSIRELKN